MVDVILELLSYILGFLTGAFVMFLILKHKYPRVFTPKQRYEIYVKAREAIASNKFGHYYMCPTLTRIVSDDYNIFVKSEYAPIFFPEMLLVKPDDVHHMNRTWWPYDRAEKRVEALDIMIKHMLDNYIEIEKL